MNMSLSSLERSLTSLHAAWTAAARNGQQEHCTIQQVQNKTKDMYSKKCKAYKKKYMHQNEASALTEELRKMAACCVEKAATKSDSNKYKETKIAGIDLCQRILHVSIVSETYIAFGFRSTFYELFCISYTT